MGIDVRGMTPLLQVYDMPAAVEFYCDKLGFEIIGSDGKPKPDFDWVLLRLHNAEVMLNTAYEGPERPPSPDPKRVAAHDDTCLYFGCPDVDAAYQYLKEKGVRASEPKVAHYGMKQSYFHDPDGYSLCLQWPASKETQQSWKKNYGIDTAKAK
jgi:catechol 2,3-dioxygenase-like lactoylglutathione lyase family enzyme